VQVHLALYLPEMVCWNRMCPRRGLEQAHRQVELLGDVSIGLAAALDQTWRSSSTRVRACSNARFHLTFILVR
jgi:hypothetical protein